MKTDNTNKPRPISEEKFIKICQSAGSMAEAAARLGASFQHLQASRNEPGMLPP